MERNDLLLSLWEEQDIAYELMNEYDSMTHCYGDVILFQAEAYIVSCIGATPDITLTEVADKLQKTTSACSQIVKKLGKKGLVEQVRNELNKRIYNLKLTTSGMQLYNAHKHVNEVCKKNTFNRLGGVSYEI